MSTNNSNKMKSKSKSKSMVWNNINSEKSYNKITSNKKHRVIMRHCSSCGWRIRNKFSLNSNMNIKIKKYQKKSKKIKNKKIGGANKKREEVTLFNFTIKGNKITFGYDVEDDGENNYKFHFYREGFKDENNNVSKMIDIGVINFTVNDTVVFISWVNISSGKMAFNEDGKFNMEKSILYGNRGYGTAMLAAFEKYIINNYTNVNELMLVVEYYTGNSKEKNALNFFYEKSGFSQIREGSAYYHKIIR